jgi:hypothetical protein
MNLMFRKIFVGYVFVTLVVMGCRATARSQPTPTPTKTPRPTFTPTSAVAPTAVVMATATPLPTDMFAPAATDTLVPTDTPVLTVTPESKVPPAPSPTPASETDFKIAKRHLLFCEGPSHTINITVLNINGAPLDGIVLKVTDSDPDTPEEVTTGDKGPGKTEFLMWDTTRIWVVRDMGGAPYTSEKAEQLDPNRPPTWDLEAIGECADLKPEECEAKRHICPMQNSYDLVFQRQW